MNISWKQGICTVSLIAIIGVGAAAQAELFGDYIGYKGCADCHQEIVDGWKTTPHAHAFATLKEQGEEKQSNAGCVRCHVVAMDQDGGYIDRDLTPELIDVQCESCHGPGAQHAASEDPADIISKPDEASCRTCHTEGQDKNFDYATKVRFVHGKAHPISSK